MNNLNKVLTIVVSRTISKAHGKEPDELLIKIAIRELTKMLDILEKHPGDKCAKAWAKSEMIDSLAQHALICFNNKWDMDEMLTEGLQKIVERVNGTSNDKSTSDPNNNQLEEE